MIRNYSLAVFVLYIFVCAAMLSEAAGISVDGGLSRDYVLLPSEKAEGSVLITNSADTPQLVKVSQADYSFRADGATVYGDASSLPRSNCLWITVAPKLLTIPAKSSAPVYFTITVPNDQTLVGSYWSLLMVEPVAVDSLEPLKAEKDKINVGITTIMRYAIQIIANIGKTGKRSIKILQKQLIADATGSILQLDIENTGERCLKPNVRVELYDPKGVLSGRYEGGKVRIYPACSVRSQIKLGKVTPGKYTALTIIDNGDQSIWGVKYALEFK